MVGDFKKGYTKDKIGEIVKKALNYWPDNVPKADLALISLGQNSEKLSLLKNLTSWIDF